MGTDLFFSPMSRMRERERESNGPLGQQLGWAEELLASTKDVPTRLPFKEKHDAPEKPLVTHIVFENDADIQSGQVPLAPTGENRRRERVAHPGSSPWHLSNSRIVSFFHRKSPRTEQNQSPSHGEINPKMGGLPPSFVTVATTSTTLIYE